AGDEAADVEEDDGDGGKQGVGDGVPAADFVLGQALGTGGGEVVLAHLLDQGGTHDHEELSVDDGDEGDDGQDQVLDAVDDPGGRPGLEAGGDHASGGQPLQGAAEDHEQDEAEPEGRHGPEDQRGRGGEPVEQRVPPPGGELAEPQYHADREDGRGAGEQQGRPEVFDDERGHGLPVDIALPEVTGDDADEVVPELDDDGLVEAVLAAEFGDLRRGHRPFLRDLEHGVAGQHSEGEEAEDDDEDH